MKLLRLALLSLPLLSGCFVNIKIPLDTDLDRTELGSKVGEASAQSVLWLFFWGDVGHAGRRAAGRHHDHHARGPADPHDPVRHLRTRDDDRLRRLVWRASRRS